MTDVAKPNGNIKASPALLRSPIVREMRRERMAGLLRAIELVEDDDTLSEFQKEVVIGVLSDVLTPETGGVW